MMKYEELRKILYRNNGILYPKIPKLCPNKKYADFIYDSFAGEEGELTAITQYIYEHIELMDNENIKKILLDIAIQEMNHLEILGSILVKMGEKPFYKNSQNHCWNSNNVNYKICNLKEMMKINIESENKSINQYKKLIRYTSNIYLRKTYERILLDEMSHLEIFKAIEKSC